MTVVPIKIYMLLGSGLGTGSLLLSITHNLLRQIWFSKMNQGIVSPAILGSMGINTADNGNNGWVFHSGIWRQERYTPNICGILMTTRSPKNQTL